MCFVYIGNNETDYEAALATLVGPLAPYVAAEYPLADYPSADLAFGAAGTDVVFACPALSADLSMSQYVPLSTYEFNDENAPEDILPPVSFPYGAAHASELQYLFALPVTVPHPPLNAQQLQLSSIMQHYWTNFAKSGSPNGSGVPFWQSFSAAVVQRAIRHTSPEAKRHYQLEMADQVRNAVDKANERLYGKRAALHFRNSRAAKSEEVKIALCT